jgi:hypothetical protein
VCPSHNTDAKTNRIDKRNAMTGKRVELFSPSEWRAAFHTSICTPLHHSTLKDFIRLATLALVNAAKNGVHDVGPVNSAWASREALDSLPGTFYS